MKVNFDDGQNPAEMNKDLTKEVETDSELKNSQRMMRLHFN